MKNCVSSFLSRLALPGLMLLILLSPALVRADTFFISVDFGNGFTGTGSFSTNGTCDPCQAVIAQLINFTFTVDDDTFTEGGAVVADLVYRRSLNTLMSGTFQEVIMGRTRLVSPPKGVERRISSSMTPTTRLQEQ